MKNAKHQNESTKFTFRNRLEYWFDNRMAKGSLGFIRILIIASLLLAVLIAGLIVILRFNEGEAAPVFWDSIATVINAWMPYSEDGSLGYLILMSIAAIVGVLFTSVLIGIITSAIETKIENLKRGNSLVLEKGHIVILGFYPGEYTLLQQLILSANGKPACVVVAENMDREEMEQFISEGLVIPKSFRIICRTADITDPDSLEKCSVETCKTIIISPTDDMKTIKAVLAVSVLLEKKGVPEIGINALISKETHRFPPSIAEANNISTFQTNIILAKMIAHSCTQIGLSETFREVFNFEGSEFYLIDLPGIEGLTFEELMIKIDGATPAGVLREGKVTLNPSKDFVFRNSDRVLVFSEENNSAKMVNASLTEMMNSAPRLTFSDDVTDVVIIGYNETLPVLLEELPETIAHVYLFDQNEDEQTQKELEMAASKNHLEIICQPGDSHSDTVLYELAQTAEHVIILNDHEEDLEKSDMRVIFLLMRLRDIRERYNLRFNITAEMQKEYNQKLVGRGDHTDFLVASSMSSLVLAQLAESPELKEVFREILSNEGNELYLKDASKAGLQGKYTVRDLRRIILQQGYVFLGHLDAEKNSRFNLPLDEELELTDKDNLIVLGQK